MNEIRKSNRSPLNRVQSILEDSEYVSSVESVYNRPLVANMRCGLWYVRPERLREKCYFKSTDGHTRQWQFSVKRLNLHMIELIEQKNGCIIVDSTRRGKAMPDALSKTVPIWCAVLNCALLGLSSDESLFLPKCVSPSEQDQIKQLIPEWTARFKQLVPKENWPKLTKPLHPIFVNQSAMLPIYEFRPDEEIIEGAHPIILCTASKQAQDGEIQMPGYIYVQGAADDHELWAPAHFSAEMMWANPNLREVGLSDSELVNRMQDAVEGFSQNPPTESKLIPAARQIYITYDTFEPSNGQWAIDLRPEAVEASRTLSIPLADGKRGSRDLAIKLETIAKLFESHSNDEFVIVGSKNSDFAECVALMLNCRYFTPSELRDQPAKYVSKEEVTKRNASIIANTGSIPSRTTQNVVGNFLRR